MDIRQRMAYLTEDEQRITGLNSPIPAGAINMDLLRQQADAGLDRIQQMMAADDDELTNAERARLPQDLEVARADSVTLNNMADQLSLHGITRTLNSQA